MVGGKLIVTGVKGAKEVTYVLKTIGRAEEMILLEAAAEIGNGAKFGEIVNAGKSTLFLGEELGFTAKEMGHLKQAGKLEGAINEALENLTTKTPSKAYIIAKNGGKHSPLIKEWGS